MTSSAAAEVIPAVHERHEWAVGRCRCGARRCRWPRCIEARSQESTLCAAHAADRAARRAIAVPALQTAERLARQVRITIYARPARLAAEAML